ncbi:aldose 1-epimerase [Sediminibacterium roseum]|uniref:Aldose 1-epimerase n=1 Tax=Sediminibacterium roseum TaxID=1978412 RepID=A0ABW9ZND7_9BACT|nr:aldose 1-epimerase [Sediminibacterium roseum]NCI48595.1 aldose 1-epimerase [Sediminibacterium roseum]
MRFEATVDHGQQYPVVHLAGPGGCRAEIYALGAMLNAFSITHNHERVNVVDGFDSVEQAKKNGTKEFRSAKLSPFVCRMTNGQYKFAGKKYTIEKFLIDGHAIHGLLYDAGFTVTRLFANEEKALVELNFLYDGSDAGYPFPYAISIVWTLEKENRLSVSTTLKNNHTHAIPLADGWHPYFIPGGSLDDCTLRFNSSTRLEYNEVLLPTGNTIADNRFENGVLLKGMELDNAFLFDPATGDPFCVLENSRLVLRIGPGKNYPVLQVYIPPHRKSIAIETLSGAPDNFNNKMGLITVMPGEERCFDVTYMVSVKQ